MSLCIEDNVQWSAESGLAADEWNIPSARPRHFNYIIHSDFPSSGFIILMSNDQSTQVSSTKDAFWRPLAEAILDAHNRDFLCESCGEKRYAGAFNRSTGGNNRVRRYTCKGKGQSCNASHSTHGLCLLARKQLEPKQLDVFRRSYSEQFASLDLPQPLKRHRDPAPTGVTPVAKRTHSVMDLTMPPPQFAIPEQQPESDPGNVADVYIFLLNYC